MKRNHAVTVVPATPNRMIDPWPNVWALARRQGGVITRAQIHGMGISERTVSRRVASGEWRAVGKHVLVHGLAPDDCVTRALVAAHAVGVTAAVLTGPGAVALRGVQDEPPWDALDPRQPPWVITPLRVELPTPVRVLRAALPDGDVLMGVQVARPDRILLDLLRLLPEPQAKALGFAA